MTSGSASEQLQEEKRDLGALLAEAVQDAPTSFVLLWMTRNKDNMVTVGGPRALATAVALLVAPGAATLDELNHNLPDIHEMLTSGLASNFLAFGWEDSVEWKDEPTKAFLHRYLDDATLWGGENLEFLLAKACVRYLSFEDFGSSRSDKDLNQLMSSEPFSHYASRYWHQHVGSLEAARRLKPMLDIILDHRRGNCSFWLSGSAGVSGFGLPDPDIEVVEAAARDDVVWLVKYLLETSESNLERLLPQKALQSLAWRSPAVLSFLLQEKPEYYCVATKGILHGVVQQRSHAVELLNLLLSHAESPKLPLSVLSSMLVSWKAEDLEALFSRFDPIPVSNNMAYNAGSGPNGAEILQLLFRLNPSLEVTQSMIEGASSFPENLRLLFDHDSHARVTSAAWKSVVSSSFSEESFELLATRSSAEELTQDVLKRAVELNREQAARWLLHKYGHWTVDTSLLGVAAVHSGSGVLVDLLARCGPGTVTPDLLIVAAATIRFGGENVRILLKHHPDVEVTKEVMVAFAANGTGSLLDLLFELEKIHDVPDEVVDEAIWQKRRLLSQSSSRACSLDVLERRVPALPYLKLSLESPLTPYPPEGWVLDLTKSHIGGFPELSMAAAHNDLAEVQRFLSQGVSVDSRSTRPCPCCHRIFAGTALQHAIRQRNPELVELLLKNGANPNVTGEPGNPLQECIQFGDSRVLSLLLEHGANVDQEDGKGVTPLYVAARVNDRYALQRLIDRGADPNIADEHGWTPYLCAVAHNSKDVEQFLLEVDASLPSLGELLALSPSKFSMPRGSNITVSAQNPGTKFSTRSMDGAASVIADHPIIPTIPFYFEVFIEEVQEGAVAIGFSTQAAYLTTLSHSALPGSKYLTWGYHSDNGRVFEESDYLISAVNPTARTGDVIGCGVDIRSGTAFFTRNGRRLHVGCNMISGQLFPVIGLSGLRIRVRTNLGEIPFVYNE